MGFFSSTQCWFFASPYVKEVGTAYLSHGVTNMILDIVVVALAIPLFWRKDKSAKTNRGLLALITMGALYEGTSTRSHRDDTRPGRAKRKKKMKLTKTKNKRHRGVDMAGAVHNKTPDRDVADARPLLLYPDHHRALVSRDQLRQHRGERARLLARAAVAHLAHGRRWRSDGRRPGSWGAACVDVDVDDDNNNNKGDCSCRGLRRWR